MAYEFKKLSTVDTVESLGDTANVLVEENGEIKRVAKTSVGESAEAMLGKIAAVEAVEEPAEGANVLIEESGALKKVSVDSFGKRELVYEFTPGIDADGNPVIDVESFLENVDDDLAWLTNKIEGIDFEIVLTQYGVYNENDIETVDSNAEFTLVASSVGQTRWLIPFAKFADYEMVIFELEFGNVNNAFNGREYFPGGAMIGIMNKGQMDESGGAPSPVTTGGCIFIESMPIKSIKIYKITH